MSVLATTAISAALSFAQAGANALFGAKKQKEAEEQAIGQAEEQAAFREERRGVAEDFAEQGSQLANRKFGLSQQQLEDQRRGMAQQQKLTGQEVQEQADATFSGRSSLGSEMNKDIREMQRARLR